MAISWMFNRVFNCVTRSAACNSVNPEMSSTIRVMLGSCDDFAGGGGGTEDDASAAAVARNLEQLRILE